MLIAYFDESGTHSGSLVTAVAGYVSTVPRWKRFEREWTEALREANVDCFHMSEYESRKGVFADWSDKKRVAVIKRLAEIIRKNAAHGVAAAVVVEDYKEVIAQMKETASPYTFCVSRCIVQLTRWAKENHLEGPITYIFEDGADYTGEIEQKKAEISSNTFVKQAFRFYDLKFADKREKFRFRPLI